MTGSTRIEARKIRPRCVGLGAPVGVLILLGVANGIGAAAGGRVGGDLQALYELGAAEGGVIKDVSGREPPLDLRIADLKSVRLSGEGLEVRGKTLIRSNKPVARLAEAIKRSGAITIEAWVRPQKAQSGPARIVTLSRDTGERNFTLGQEGEAFEVRLRTTKTNHNGIPAVGSKGEKPISEWTHVVYARDRAHAHMKMREVAYFLGRLASSEAVEANGKTILENSLITVSTESGDGRHNDVKRELSGIFHAITSANGRFKTGQFLDVGAEGIDLYNTMLEAMKVTRRLGPKDRKGRRVDSIRA